MAHSMAEEYDIEDVVETLQRVKASHLRYSRQPRSEKEKQDLEIARNVLDKVGSRYPDHLKTLTNDILQKLKVPPPFSEKADWPLLWPSSPPADSVYIETWLRATGLVFNPFGPEVAELDPWLPWYVIDSVYIDARSNRPLVVIGAPGAGKTAAALMLAYGCGHPPANPHRPGTFPVYYPLRLVTAHVQDASSALSPLVQTTAREILRYLSLRPKGLSDLPSFSQDAMRYFLTLAYAGSESLLAAEVERLPPSLQKRLLSRSLSESLSQSPRLLDQDWLDLLPGALPAGFERYEWLVDVPDRISALLPDKLPGVLNQLIDLAIPLAVIGIHLKLFVSDEVAGILGDMAGLDVVPLRWQDKDLKLMLEHRIRQAGGDSLMAFCGPEVGPDLETHLIQAAQGSPRRLVQLGNALLKSAAQRRDPHPQITERDWEAAQKELERQAELRPPMPPRRRYLTRLRQILVTHFEGELRTLCFDLGVDYDDLRETGKANKARELVEYLERRNRIPELVELGKRLRPSVSWEERA